jgi:phosphoribosylglycinamide formyltransferase 1
LDGPVARPLPIAVFVSGEGTTLEGLVATVRAEALPVRVALVVVDRPEAPALARAERLGLPVRVLPSRGVDRNEWGRQVTDELTAAGVELVVLAGFLRMLPASWVVRWQGRAINIHPALLPRYGGPGMYGDHVHRAVLAAGDRESGATVHLVTAEVDGGPILAQERVPIRPDDTPETLRARLHPVEVALLAATVRRFATGELPLPYPERPPAA